MTFSTRPGCTGDITWDWAARGVVPSAETAAATILVAIYLAFVLLRVQREWVRVPAIAYARQFLAACDALSSPKRTATNKNKRKRTDAD